MLPNRPPQVSRLYFVPWIWAWATLWIYVMLPLRVRIKGLERVPREGGAMLLANHTTFMDVLACFWGVHRPTHGIGSEQVFRLPVAGTLLKWLGGIPYAKGAKDGAAVRALAEAFEKGSIIGMFPEGFRSWTGEPLPIRSGTGRLVKSLGCPVVYCRVYTGFLQMPRWAKWPRLVPWHMEYDYEEFSGEATADDINQAIARGLAIDPDRVELPEGSWGFRLAEGLPTFLWACPSCFEVEGLKVADDKNCVQCSGCQRRWRVDLLCHLVPESEDTARFTVRSARAALNQHFTLETPVGCDHMMVTSIKRGHLRAEPVADGVCRLGPDAIEVLQGEEVVWSLPYTDMKAVLLQFRNALQVRVEGVNFQLDPVGQSTLRWHHHLAMRCGGMVG